MWFILVWLLGYALALYMFYRICLLDEEAIRLGDFLGTILLLLVIWPLAVMILIGVGIMFKYGDSWDRLMDTKIVFSKKKSD